MFFLSANNAVRIVPVHSTVPHQWEKTYNAREKLQKKTKLLKNNKKGGVVAQLETRSERLQEQNAQSFELLSIKLFFRCPGLHHHEAKQTRLQSQTRAKSNGSAGFKKTSERDSQASTSTDRMLDTPLPCEAVTGATTSAGATSTPRYGQGREGAQVPLFFFLPPAFSRLHRSVVSTLPAHPSSPSRRANSIM